MHKIYLCGAESEYNAACTAGMPLSHFRMLVHELVNEDPDMAPKEDPLIVMYGKSAMRRAKIIKYIKHSINTVLKQPPSPLLLAPTDCMT